MLMRVRNSEKKGIIVLVCLVVLLFVLPQAMKSKEPPFFLLVESEPLDTSSLPMPSHVAPIELNTADSATLVRLKGIGPYYAQKILRYRERLGGFYTPRQLKELTYKYLVIDSLLPFFTTDPTLIRKLDLDTMNFKAVLRHPYLEYEDVCLIFNAKRELGSVSYDSLARHGVLPPQKLKKIRHYFK